ncbi:MAG TPA: hypothetical protein VFS53_00595 [Gemmatimonadota bacterium]|nr:hypothetical protein [Gemmatimonadota bacterium]
MNGSTRALGRALTVAAGLALMAPGGPARALAQTDTLAQAETASLAALRAQIENRYQVQEVPGGILLLPKYGNVQVQNITITDGGIAVNGQPVTGPELRAMVAEDADAIVRLTYLAADDRRILFGIGGAPMPADTTAVAAGDPTAGAAGDTTAADESEDETGGMVTVESTDDRVRVGASVHVRSEEVVNGDVVAVLGSVEVDGRVTGDVVAVGGSVDLGPEAVVEGEVVVVGGMLDRAPGAQIMGGVEEVAWGGPNVHFGGPEFHPFLEGVGGLIMTIVWVIVLGALAALMYLLARRPVERMAYRISQSPWKAALIGLVAQILFFPVLVLSVILLAISIIGIPLLLAVPFAIVALAVGMLIGFTAVARVLGSSAERRFGWQHDNPFIAVLIGVGIIMLVSFFASALGVPGGPLGLFAVILGILGFVIQYAAWTVGLGALLLTRFGTRYGWGEAPGPGTPAIPSAPLSEGPMAPPAEGSLDTAIR